MALRHITRRPARGGARLGRAQLSEGSTMSRTVKNNSTDGNGKAPSEYDLRLAAYKQDLLSRFGKDFNDFSPVFYTFQNAIMAAGCLPIQWRLGEFIIRHGPGNHNIHVVGCSGRRLEEMRKVRRCRQTRQTAKPIGHRRGVRNGSARSVQVHACLPGDWAGTNRRCRYHCEPEPRPLAD